MKRKVFIGLLALTLCVGVVACGKKADESASDSSTEATSEDVTGEVEKEEYSVNGFPLMGNDHSESFDVSKIDEIVNAEDFTSPYVWVSDTACSFNLSPLTELSESSYSDGYTLTESSYDSVDGRTFKTNTYDKDSKLVISFIYLDDVISSIFVSFDDNDFDIDYNGITRNTTPDELVQIAGEPVYVSVDTTTNEITYNYNTESISAVFVFDLETKALNFMVFNAL